LTDTEGPASRRTKGSTVPGAACSPHLGVSTVSPDIRMLAVGVWVAVGEEEEEEKICLSQSLLFLLFQIVLECSVLYAQLTGDWTITLNNNQPSRQLSNAIIGGASVHYDMIAHQSTMG